jgi:hypothetical protein
MYTHKAYGFGFGKMSLGPPYADDDALAMPSSGSRFRV